MISDHKGLDAADATSCVCLRSDVVQRVPFDPAKEVLPYLRPSTMIVDTGTIEYVETIEKLADPGLRFLDAPVSGIQKRAGDRTLTVMFGGDADLLEDLRPALSTAISKILHMGPAGSAQLTKQIN